MAKTEKRPEFAFVDAHRSMEGDWRTVGASKDPILVSARIAICAHRNVVALHVILVNQMTVAANDILVRIGAEGELPSCSPQG